MPSLVFDDGSRVTEATHIYCFPGCRRRITLRLNGHEEDGLNLAIGSLTAVYQNLSNAAVALGWSVNDLLRPSETFCHEHAHAPELRGR